MFARTNSSAVIIGASSLDSLIAKLGSSCQEGLLEPPRASKKQKVNAHDCDAKPAPRPQKSIPERSLQDEQKWEARAQIAMESQTNPAKRRSVPQRLDKVQEKANTARNSRPVGLSSKLAPDSKKPRSGNPMPNFDLQLTTLKRSRSPTPGASISTDDCWDELPLISEVWEQDNTMSEIGFVEVEGCEVPPSKRSRTDLAASSSGLPSSHKKVYCILSVSPYSRNIRPSRAKHFKRLQSYPPNDCFFPVLMTKTQRVTAHATLQPGSRLLTLMEFALILFSIPFPIKSLRMIGTSFNQPLVNGPKMMQTPTEPCFAIVLV